MSKFTSLLKIGENIYDVSKSLVDDFLKAGAKTVKPTAANRAKAEKVTPKVKKEIKEKIASTMAAVQRRNQPKELQSPTVRRALEKVKAGKRTAVVKPTGTALVKARPTSVVPKSRPPVPARKPSTAVTTRKPSSVVPTRKPSVPARRPARTPLTTSSRVRETMSPAIKRALIAAGLGGIAGGSYLASKLTDRSTKAGTTGKSKAIPKGMADKKPTKPTTTAKPKAIPKGMADKKITPKLQTTSFNKGGNTGFGIKGNQFVSGPEERAIMMKYYGGTGSQAAKAAMAGTQGKLKELGMASLKKELREARKKRLSKVVKKKEGSKVVPSKYKGFSKLPEKVQQKMDSGLAKQYMSGGKVARQVKGYGKARKPKK